MSPSRLVQLPSVLDRDATLCTEMQRWATKCHLVQLDHSFRIRSVLVQCDLDESVGHLGLRVLQTPPRCPMANAICERVIGTIRRECLDWLIPLSEAHLRLVLKSWIGHYNRGRAHMALGPGVPDPPTIVVTSSIPKGRHHLCDFGSVRAKAILGGLHHEYSLASG